MEQLEQQLSSFLNLNAIEDNPFLIIGILGTTGLIILLIMLKYAFSSMRKMDEKRYTDMLDGE